MTARWKRVKRFARRATAGIAVAGVVAAGAAGGVKLADYAGERLSPGHLAKKNPPISEALRQGDYHRYDLEVIRAHPWLKELRPVAEKHWETIRAIAGDKYNALTVLDTLSRHRFSALGDEIKKHEVALSSKDATAEKKARYARKIDIFKRALGTSGADELMRELYPLSSGSIKEARRVNYGSNWEYGSPKLKLPGMPALPRNTVKPTVKPPKGGR